MFKLCCRQNTGTYHRLIQDHYRLYTDEEKVIAAVADGHGKECYVRSSMGARIACAAAIRLLRAGTPAADFPKAVKETFDRMVQRHLERWPLNEREQKLLGDKAPHLAYGTTLLAAVMTADKAEVFQLGDGEIRALDAEGRFMQLLPKDKDCFHSITTSMIQSPERVVRSFRHCEYPGCSALTLCTDGYSDSWKLSEGLLEPEKLADFTEKALYEGRHGDDQTLVMVYLPQAVETESFRNKLQNTFRSLRELLRKQRLRDAVSKQLAEMTEYLEHAFDKAEKMRQKQDPDYETYLQKLQASCTQYLQLKQQLNDLGKEWLICL